MNPAFANPISFPTLTSREIERLAHGSRLASLPHVAEFRWFMLHHLNYRSLSSAPERGCGVADNLAPRVQSVGVDRSSCRALANPRPPRSPSPRATAYRTRACSFCCYNLPGRVLPCSVLTTVSLSRRSVNQRILGVEQSPAARWSNEPVSSSANTRNRQSSCHRVRSTRLAASAGRSSGLCRTYRDRNGCT